MGVWLGARLWCGVVVVYCVTVMKLVDSDITHHQNIHTAQLTTIIMIHTINLSIRILIDWH